jgi:hypothetical protein
VVAWLAEIGFALARAGTPTADPLAAALVVAAVALVAGRAAPVVLDRLGSRLGGYAHVAIAAHTALVAGPAVTVDPSGRATTFRLSVVRR